MGDRTAGSHAITGIRSGCIYGSYLCPATEFTRSRISYACTWGTCGSTKPAISTKVNNNINGAITSDCICPGHPSDPWSTAWDDDVWDNAIPGSSSDGACCCRAHGMMLALRVLGVGLYTHAYVNERSEPGQKTPNPQTPVYCSGCGHLCQRGAWHDGLWHRWEGVCRSAGAGTKCYGPYGRYEGTYDEIRDAFGPYHWYWVDVGGPHNYANKCPGGYGHLPAP